MNWQPHQIVYLQVDRVRLFAEVIQVVVDRQVLWLRPLALKVPDESDARAADVTVATNVDANHACSDRGGGDHGRSVIHDLRQGSDLLWPMTWVQPALDIDAIPVIAALGPESPKLDPPNRIAHQHLCHFIQQLYRQQFGAE
ncbi:hypothetical protein [Trichothermofontia sp.]